MDLITVACWKYAAALLPPILLLRESGNKPGSISDCSPAAGMRTGRFTTMLAASQSGFRLTHAKPTDSRSPWRSDQGRSGRTPPGSSPGQLSSALECSCRPMAQVFYSSRYLRAAGIFTKGNHHWGVWGVEALAGLDKAPASLHPTPNCQSSPSSHTHGQNPTCVSSV